MRQTPQPTFVLTAPSPSHLDTRSTPRREVFVVPFFPPLCSCSIDLNAQATTACLGTSTLVRQHHQPLGECTTTTDLRPPCIRLVMAFLVRVCAAQIVFQGDEKTIGKTNKWDRLLPVRATPHKRCPLPRGGSPHNAILLPHPMSPNHRTHAYTC